MGPPAKEATPGKQKERKKWDGKRKEGRTGQVFKETNRKKQVIIKHFDLKDEKEAIKDFWKGNRFAFEYEMDNKLGIIPGN